MQKLIDKQKTIYTLMDNLILLQNDKNDDYKAGWEDCSLKMQSVLSRQHPVKAVSIKEIVRVLTEFKEVVQQVLYGEVDSVDALTQLGENVSDLLDDLDEQEE